MRKFWSCWLPSSAIAPLTPNTRSAISAACSALTSGGWVSAVANVARSIRARAYRAPTGAPHAPETRPLREDEAAEERVELLRRAAGSWAEAAISWADADVCCVDAETCWVEADDCYATLATPPVTATIWSTRVRMSSMAEPMLSTAPRVDSTMVADSSARFAPLDDRDRAVRLGLHLADRRAICSAACCASSASLRASSATTAK